MGTEPGRPRPSGQGRGRSNRASAPAGSRRIWAPRDYPVDSGWGSFPAGHLAVGRRLVPSPEAEQGLKGRHRRAAAVVAKDELVEVDLQTIGRDAAVGALQPGLQVRGGAVGARQKLLRVGVVAALQPRPVVEAGDGKLAVARPAVGVDDRSRLDARFQPAGQRRLAGVGEELQAAACPSLGRGPRRSPQREPSPRACGRGP